MAPSSEGAYFFGDIMDIGLMILLAAISVATTLTAVLRLISWRTIMRYHGIADVAFTGLLLVLFSGTVSGMVIAVIAGLIFTIVLTVGKKLTRKGP